MSDGLNLKNAEPVRLSNAYQNWYRFSRNPTAVVGAVIVILAILAAIFARLITPYPQHVGAVVNFKFRHLPPSADFWFGTDNVGRDIFTRVIFGLRVSLTLALVVLGTAVPFGTIMGLIAGYFGGWTETIIMRLTDVALAIPPLVMALAVAAVLSPNLTHSMLAIAALWWTWHTRLVYSMTRQIPVLTFASGPTNSMRVAAFLSASRMPSWSISAARPRMSARCRRASRARRRWPSKWAACAPISACRMCSQSVSAAARWWSMESMASRSVRSRSAIASSLRR
jgi:hypothetical protein